MFRSFLTKLKNLFRKPKPAPAPAPAPELPEVPVVIGGLDLGPALKIIKEFEGLRLKAYLDPVGIPTIGYGCIRYPDGSKVKLGQEITKAQAEEYLVFEVLHFVNQMKRVIKVDLTNNQMCALISFTYNLGAGALASSTLLKKLNMQYPATDVANEFNKWVYAGGKVLPGLVRRRAAEKALFLTGV